uniref:Uncharacterized protein n=1 Tax=Ananas comosus var. bracteatus TaxID=296719 RepID=A0A6V7PXL0_ANACO|nr:unnamed protein product [Ananas comosus var. bracteatus]
MPPEVSTVTAGPVDILLQSGDRRDILTSGYFDPTSVQWCALGDARVHFTYTSGLIPRRRVFFSGKVVVHPTREPSGVLFVLGLHARCEQVLQAMSFGTRREVVVVILLYPLVRRADTKETLREWTEELCICGGSGQLIGQ